MEAAVTLVGSAWLVALTLTVCPVLMMEGAVYNPFERVPTGLGKDQDTAVSVLPVTVAVNCLLCAGLRDVFAGLMLMLILLAVS